MLSRARSLGLVAQCGFEYELFVFKETPDSVRAKGYRGLVPVTPGNFGYSVLRAASQADLFQELLAHCIDFRMPLEGLHCETGPGVWEAALAGADALEAADRAVLFKTFAKSFFAEREMMATFMAKWSMDYPGQSGHFHFSLHRADASASPTNVFAGDDIPDTARWALGGLMRHTPELLPMLAPTVNSFTRLVKGAWAPTASTWGVENRTAAFRFIPGSAARQHIECRVGGADGNPYLVAAATLGAALLGIEQRLKPGAAVQGNALRCRRRTASRVALLADAAGICRTLCRLGGGEGALRQHLRRPLRGHPKMGKRTPRTLRGRLATGALLRNHLKGAQNPRFWSPACQGA